MYLCICVHIWVHADIINYVYVYVQLYVCIGYVYVYVWVCIRMTMYTCVFVHMCVYIIIRFTAYIRWKCSIYESCTANLYYVTITLQCLKSFYQINKSFCCTLIKESLDHQVTKCMFGNLLLTKWYQFVRTHIRYNSHACARTHTHAHTRKHTHMHACTHAYTPNIVFSLSIIQCVHYSLVRTQYKHQE